MYWIIISSCYKFFSTVQQHTCKKVGDNVKKKKQNFQEILQCAIIVTDTHLVVTVTPKRQLTFLHTPLIHFDAWYCLSGKLINKYREG